MRKITLQEALELLHSAEIVSLKGVTFDKKRKKGGRVYFMPECRKVNESAALIEQHKAHFTFDMRVYLNGKPLDTVTRIHALLILQINGFELLL